MKEIRKEYREKRNRRNKIELKEINLILENTEEIRLEKENVGWMQISDVKTTLVKMEENSLCKIKQAGKIMIEILNDFNFNPLKKENSAYKRLTDFHDIVAVEIVLADEQTELYYIDYDEANNGVDNINQEETIIDDKLIIIVGEKIKTKKIKRIRKTKG